MKCAIYDELFWGKLVKILCELYYCTPNKVTPAKSDKKISCIDNPRTFKKAVKKLYIQTPFTP